MSKNPSDLKRELAIKEYEITQALKKTRGKVIIDGKRRGADHPEKN